MQNNIYFKMRTFLTLLFCCIFLLPAHAQNRDISISGRIVDINNQPIPYANIVFLSLPDSTFVSGTVSGEDGSFRLANPKNAELLRITSIGYATIYSHCKTGDAGTLQMQPDTQILGEVEIKADLPKVRIKGDVQVTTVQGSILEKAGTGNDLLNKLPGVSADEGSVNVFGSGTAEIYINGRKMRDATELSQLESDNIKQVEVVRNPGARYDATVKAVVRIYTKKAQGEGFSFNNRFQTRYQYGWGTLDQLNANYRKGGFDLSGMVSGSTFRNEDNKTIIQETFLDKTWRQVSDLHAYNRTPNISATLSLNYQFNENHSAGARYDFDRTPKNRWNIDQMYSEVFQDGLLYETNTSQGWQDRPGTSHSANIYYNGQIGDWNIDFNADGMWSYSKVLQDMTENYTPVDGILQEQNITSYNKDENTLYAAKLVIGYPLWGGNISFGGEYTYTDRKNRYINDQGILDDDDSNIRENATSVFLEYARSIGKLQAKAGVRYEHINSDYYESGVRIDEQSRIYDDVFPNVTLSLPVGKAQLSLSYTGGIQRPSYWNLRSNITYANRYTYESGNPQLQPSLYNRLSLNASYKWIYFNAGYTHAKDVIIQISEAYSEDNPTISMLIPVNKGNSDKINATLSLSPTIGIWSPQLTLMYLQQWYEANTPEGIRNFNHPIGNFSWRNNFRLLWGLLLDTDLYATTLGDEENVSFEEVGWAANISLRKEFLNEQLSVQVQGTDLFNSARARITIYNGNRLMVLDEESRRRFTLTVRYTFNAAKSKYKGTGAGQGQKYRM